jgi:hypothetical protein
MDIHGLRTLNLIGTVLFFIFGMLLSFAYGFPFLIYMSSNGGFELLCGTMVLIWLCLIVILTTLFYKNTVLELDEENYDKAKHWTLIAVIFGWLGGIIPFIIFIISLVSFDDALRTQQSGPPVYYQYPPPQPFILLCNKCARPIPLDSKLCPYCGIKQIRQQTYKKTMPLPPEK